MGLSSGRVVANFAMRTMPCDMLTLAVGRSHIIPTIRPDFCRRRQPKKVAPHKRRLLPARQAAMAGHGQATLLVWAKPSAPPAAAAAATAALPFPADAAVEYVRNEYFNDANRLSELHANEWPWTVWAAALYKEHVDPAGALSNTEIVEVATAMRVAVERWAGKCTTNACGVSLHSKCDFRHRTAFMPAQASQKSAAVHSSCADGACKRSRRWNEAENSIPARRRRRHVATFACHVATIAGDGRD